MHDRARPPDDIAPEEFFTRWVPEAVAGDPERRARLGDGTHTLEFRLEGEGGGDFTVRIAGGDVTGAIGPAEQADLRIALDVATWRALNRGDVSAPEALIRRRLRLRGNLLLGIKLHFILG